MHPFGGTPICPRCQRAVYAAEQIMGPGRKLYHKPCLACTTCGKRLDSYNLVEHDQDPYCKTCHVKNFGTRDLRHANLPDRDDVFISPPTSPIRAPTTLPPTFPSPSPALKHGTGTNGNVRNPPLTVRRIITGSSGVAGGGAFDKLPSITPPASLLKPTRALSPVRGERNVSPLVTASSLQEADEDNRNYDQPGIVQAPAFDDEVPVDVTPVVGPFTPTHTGRSGPGNLPRTVPLSPTKIAQANSSPSKATPIYTSTPPPTHRSTSSVSSTSGNYVYASGPQTPVSSNITGSVISGRMGVPLIPNSTGTRYGAALGGKVGSPVVRTPTGAFNSYGGNPVCSRCQKTVYFAEQVKAIGKTWHKGCLRCMECNTTLDSSRLTEREGDPFCHRCYGKLYGPQGSGYALLGKAGG